jgi:hypothetical protein
VILGISGDATAGAATPGKERRAAMARTVSLIVRNVVFTIVVPGAEACTFPG